MGPGPRRVVIGIDVGGTSMKGARVTAEGVIAARRRAATPVGEGEEAVLDALANLCRSLGAGRDVEAVGVGVPGAIRRKSGVVASSPNVPCWNDYPIGPLLARRIGARVIIDNDANVAALAETWLGAGRGVRNLLMATLGTGIGGGVVLGGRIWRGDAGRAGELGHTVVSARGPLCACGARGCVEAYAGAAGIRRAWLRRADRRIGVGARGVADLARAPQVDELARRARGGDARCLAVFDAAGRALGVAFATWLNVLDVHTIVLGGGVAAAIDLLEPPARHELRRRLFGLDVAKIRILRGMLGDDAGVLGAARLLRP